MSGGWRQWMGRMGMPYRGVRYCVLGLYKFISMFKQSEEAQGIQQGGQESIIKPPILLRVIKPLAWDLGRHSRIGGFNNPQSNQWC
ncbi:MAG: hypothetical protein ACP5NQ_00875 [Vulcanisaeta sp.]